MISNDIDIKLVYCKYYFNMNIIPQNQFDENKLTFKNVSQDSHSTQYTKFFEYQFQNEKTSALILTDPIKIKGKCIPTVDDLWQKCDNDCLYFYLNLNDPDGQLLSTQVIDKIDQKFNHLCGDNNSNIIIDYKQIKKLRYVKCHRTYGMADEMNEDVFSNSETLNRVKIQLDTEYNQYADKNDPKVIRTRVFLPVDKTVSIADREFNSDPELITCLDDLRKIFHTNCTVRFVLKVNRFWIQKQLDSHNFRQC